MPRVLVAGTGRWLLDGADPQWPRPPDPHPEVSLVAWGRHRTTWYACLTWTDADSWQARSRGGRLSPPILYTRWVPATGVRRTTGVTYESVPRLRLDGPAEDWPSPPVGPDDRPWYGGHRVYPPIIELDLHHFCRHRNADGEQSAPRPTHWNSGRAVATHVAA